MNSTCSTLPARFVSDAERLTGLASGPQREWDTSVERAHPRRHVFLDVSLRHDLSSTVFCINDSEFRDAARILVAVPETMAVGEPVCVNSGSIKFGGAGGARAVFSAP